LAMRLAQAVRAAWELPAAEVAFRHRTFLRP
jgi:hypothetical protein